MKSNNSIRKNMYLILAVIPVILLSGCKPLDWIKEKLGGKRTGTAKLEEVGVAAVQTAGIGDVPAGMLAVWADGTEMVSDKEFNEKLALFIRERPELKEMESFMPVVKAQILGAIVSNKIIEKWIKENAIDQTDDYKNMVKQVFENIKDRINIEFFGRKHQVSISESEKKDYYDQNKGRIALISRGGVKATGVKFDNEEKAKAFAEKAKSKGSDFAKLAEADKLTVEDFQFVNNQSRGINSLLVDKIVDMKVPSISDSIKVGDKEFWVVKTTEKQEASYKPYAEVKESVEAMVKQTKQGEVLQKKLEELKTKYGVKVKENAFMPPQQPKAPMMPPIKSPKGKKKSKKVADASNDAQPIVPIAKVA